MRPSLLLARRSLLVLALGSMVSLTATAASPVTVPPPPVGAPASHPIPPATGTPIPEDPMLTRVRQKIVQQGVPQAQRAITQTTQDYAHAQQVPAVAQVFHSLDAQFNPTTGAGPMAQVINPKDSAQAQLYTLWLASKVYSNAADGRYSYLYGSLLSRTRLHGEQLDTRGAAVQFFRASLALAIDSARCTDPSGVTTVMHGYEDSPMGNALKAQIQTLDPATLVDARFEAISLETALGERAPAGWLCLQSQSALRHQPVSFVADVDWRARRQHLLDEAMQSALALAIRSSAPVQPLPASAVANPRGIGHPAVPAPR